MAGRRVRYTPTRSCFTVQDLGDVELMDSDHAFGSIDILGSASVFSLRLAMKNVYAEYQYGQGAEDALHWLPRFKVEWTLDPKEDFDEDMSLVEVVSLVLLRSGDLVIEVLATGRRPRREDESWPEAEAILTRWLKARRGTLVSLDVGDIGYRGYWVVRFVVPFRGLSIYDIQAIGSEALGLLDAFSDGTETLDSLAVLLRSGHASALIGTPEGQLVEAKRQVNLEDDKGRLELAKDVSAMANSSVGGLIVVGLETQRRYGVDEIVRIRPLPRSNLVRTIRSSIDRLIFPPIVGLNVEFVPAGPGSAESGSLIMILVPPQPGELFPFLVVGAVSDGRVLGNYIGFFERRSEDTVAQTAASIHSGLSAGLALLRGLPAQGDQLNTRP